MYYQFPLSPNLFHVTLRLISHKTSRATNITITPQSLLPYFFTMLSRSGYKRRKIPSPTLDDCRCYKCGLQFLNRQRLGPHIRSCKEDDININMSTITYTHKLHWETLLLGTLPFITMWKWEMRFKINWKTNPLCWTWSETSSIKSQTTLPASILLK